MSQKGGIALILLILVVIAGVVVGAYFISNNTSFFSNAGFASIYIPKRNEVTPTPTPAQTSIPQAQTDTEYDNPFGDEYENPFNNI